MKKISPQKGLTLARIAAGLRQNELADKINEDAGDNPRISVNMVSKLENGWKVGISGWVADSICKHLGISEKELTAGGINVRRK